MAGIVLLLSMIGAIVIASSTTTVPILSDIQQQGQGIAAIAALGGGLTSSGLLAGIGAILRVLVIERLEKLGPAPGETKRTADSGAGSDPDQDQLPLGEPRRRDRTETRRRERQ